MSLAALLLALQPVQPAPPLPVSPPEQSVDAYAAEWRDTLRAWRACDFPRETYRYVAAMSEILVEAKRRAGPGAEPARPEPEFSAFAQESAPCRALAAEMEPLIEAYAEAADRPGLLRPWRAPGAR